MRIARPSTVGFHALLALVLGGGVAAIVLLADTVPGWTAWLGVALAALVLRAGLRGPWRRWRAVRQPFPSAWREWLAARVPLYARLGEAERARFERDVQLVLAEARFEGVDGIGVTDELRLGVAAGAALLLHGRPEWELPLDRTFLFYPGHFGDDYTALEPAYDGMVHPQGPVILSAPAVRRSWARADGSNVVLHELAHLFDFEDLYADGVPSLLAPGSVKGWTALVRRETALIRRGQSMLRAYAATNAAEFFAVATEVFFERSTALARRHPDLVSRPSRRSTPSTRGHPTALRRRRRRSP